MEKSEAYSWNSDDEDSEVGNSVSYPGSGKEILSQLRVELKKEQGQRIKQRVGQLKLKQLKK